MTSGDKEEEKGKIRVSDEEVNTIMYKINKQQDTLHNTRKYSHCFLITLN